jgi:hypothetical protein
MKKNKQCPLPMDSAYKGSPDAQRDGCSGKLVSLKNYAISQKDKQTHEIAKRYVEYYKIFG